MLWAFNLQNEKSNVMQNKNQIYGLFSIWDRDMIRLIKTKVFQRLAYRLKNIKIIQGE